MAREGYKETEIGEIPEEWDVGPLSDIVYVNPKTSTTNLSDISEVTYLPMENVGESGKILIKSVKKLVEVKFGYTSFKDEDVLFAKITPCMENGKGALVRGLKNEVGFGSTEFHVLRAKPSGYSVFIYHKTKSEKFRLVSERFFSGSAGQQRVSKDVFYQYIIPIPPLSEQHRIAGVLSNLDDVIEKTKALIAKFRRVKAGLMQDMLTKGIDEQGRVRSEATHAFKDTAFGRLPAEWKVVKIGDLLYENVEPISMRDDEIYRLISIRRRNGGIFEREKLPGNKVLTKDLHRVIPGTFLISNRQIVHGACAYVTEEFADTAVSSAYTALKGQNNCDIQFFSWLARSPLMYKYFLDASQGVVLEKMNFHLQEWLDLPIFLPTHSEQGRIAAVLTSAENNIEREETHRDKLLAIKKGLMMDLLTGRVRVPAGVAEAVPGADA